MAAPSSLRFFPYDDPYQNQAAAMDRIAGALEAGDDVLFEGACGTGKTLAALTPSLEFARRTGKTVVITTNVHQQMRQFVAEARAIRETEPIRAVVFQGKASMCHLDVGFRECQALRESTYDRFELERDRAELERRQRTLLERSRDGDAEAGEARATVMGELESVEAELAEAADRKTCEHFYGNLATDPAGFESWLFDDIRTPADVYARAEERGTCGYERLKAAMDGVDLAVCNYHHLLDPAIREQFFRWLGRDPTDVVTVFDEAHNIEGAAREHATRTLAEPTLEAAIAEAMDLDDDRAVAAEGLVRAFRDALVETYERALGADPDVEVGEDWTDLPVDDADGPDALTAAFRERRPGRGLEASLRGATALGRELDSRYERAYRQGRSDRRRESALRRAAAFIGSFVEEANAPGQYPLVGARRDDRSGDLIGRAELYTCIPRDVTRGLFEEVHASVLMSATLRPFDVTAEVLGLETPRTMAFGLSFPEANRRTFAVDVPPLFASRRDDPEVQATVTGVLEDAITYTPGNVLVFFPSYAEAERYAGRVDVDDPVMLDEAGTPAEGLRESFAGRASAALFTSLWGTLAEGVSFDGDAARSAVVVGVPYPYLDDRLEAVQAAYDEAFAGRGRDPGWEYAVEIPTVRKTRQAIGRVIRTPDEIGTRVLVDRRYTMADLGDYSVRGSFPPDERAELIDVRPGKLKFALHNFYAGHDAWDGPVPRP